MYIKFAWEKVLDLVKNMFEEKHRQRFVQVSTKHITKTIDANHTIWTFTVKSYVLKKHIKRTKNALEPQKPSMDWRARSIS